MLMCLWSRVVSRSLRHLLNFPAGILALLVATCGGAHAAVAPPHAIGELARDAGVHSLLLGHISPAVEENQDVVLDSIKRSYQGPVSPAADRIRVLP